MLLAWSSEMITDVDGFFFLFFNIISSHTVVGREGIGTAGIGRGACIQLQASIEELNAHSSKNMEFPRVCYIAVRDKHGHCEFRLGHTKPSMFTKPAEVTSNKVMTCIPPWSTMHITRCAVHRCRRSLSSLAPSDKLPLHAQPIQLNLHGEISPTIRHFPKLLYTVRII